MCLHEVLQRYCKIYTHSGRKPFSKPALRHGYVMQATPTFGPRYTILRCDPAKPAVKKKKAETLGNNHTETQVLEWEPSIVSDGDGADNRIFSCG